MYWKPLLEWIATARQISVLPKGGEDTADWCWASGKKELRSHSQTGNPPLTFSREVVFRMHPLWKIKSFMKSKDQTRGCENTSGKEAGAAKIRESNVCEWAAVTPGWYQWPGVPGLYGRVLKALEEFSLWELRETAAEKQAKSTWEMKEKVMKVKLHTSDTRKQSRGTCAFKGEPSCQVTAIWRRLIWGLMSLASPTFYVFSEVFCTIYWE